MSEGILIENYLADFVSFEFLLMAFLDGFNLMLSLMLDQRKFIFRSAMKMFSFSFKGENNCSIWI